jgi:List-Bact-rpt repeat protein
MVARMRCGVLLVLIGAALVAGACSYQPGYGEGQLACGPGGACPAALACASDNRCYSATVDVTVSLAGDGSGRVTSQPQGIDCGARCTARLGAALPVSLTAAPTSTSVFAGWVGDCAGGGACQLDLDAAKTVRANFALHGDRRWVDHLVSAGQTFVDKVAVDPLGNVIAVGAIAPNPTTTPSALVRKYAGDTGTVAWSHVIDVSAAATPLMLSPAAVAVDAQGNAYVAFTASSLAGSVIIAGTTISGDQDGNVVLARFAAGDGHVEWAKQFGGSGKDRPHALAMSGTDLFLAGEYSSNPGSFGSFPLAGAAGHLFLIRVDPANGTVLAAKDLPGNASVNAIAVNGPDLLLVGDFLAAMTIDGQSISPSAGGASDGMIFDFATSNLRAQWAKSFGDATGDDSAFGVAPYPGGGFVVTGYFHGSIYFAAGGLSLTSHGGADAFIVRFDAAGNHLWSFRYGGAMDDVGQDVAVDPGGAVVLLGNFAHDITLGTISLTGTTDVFVTRMSAGATPVHEWAVKLGGSDYDYATGLALDAASNVFIAGGFTGMTDLDGMPLTAQVQDGYTLAVWR